MAKVEKKPEECSCETCGWRRRALAAETELARLGHGTEVIDVITDQGSWITSHVGDAAWDTAELRARRRAHHLSVFKRMNELVLERGQRAPELVGAQWVELAGVDRSSFERERDAMRDQLDFLLARYMSVGLGVTGRPSKVGVLELIEWLNTL